MINITTLNRIFRRDHQYEKFSSWVGFLIFLNNSFLHPKGKAHTVVTRDVAKTTIFPLLSCVVNQVTWFKILNSLKNIVNWIPIVAVYKFLIDNNIRCVSQYQVPAVDNAKFEFWRHLLMATPISSEIAQYESKKLFFFKIVLFYERHLQFLNCWYEFLHSAKICFVRNFLWNVFSSL